MRVSFARNDDNESKTMKVFFEQYFDILSLLNEKYLFGTCISDAFFMQTLLVELNYIFFKSPSDLFLSHGDDRLDSNKGFIP